MTHISFHHLTQAEQYTHIAQFMTHLSQEHLEQMGAKKIAEFKNALSMSLDNEIQPELGPKGKQTTEGYIFILYQFKDNSQIWYVHDSTTHCLQLRGIYNGRWRHTHFQVAGDEIKEMHAPAGHPSIWYKSVEELDLNVRSTNCLKAENIYFIGDLIRRSEQDIRLIPNLGKVSLSDIKEAMEKRGLRFNTDVGDWGVTK